jgi:formylglycine-generating enzyme required for sulfatase activity
VVLLCDALNEMQRSGNGRDLMAQVRDYLRDRQPWVVSCRVRDYQDDLQDLPDVGKVRLKPLDLPRIKDVINRRFHEESERAAALWADLKGSDDLLKAWQAFEAMDKAEVFWERVWPDALGKWYDTKNYPLYQARETMHTDRRRMMLLCRNPFMLFMVCGTFERMGSLPPNRGALFATFVDNLLRREEANSRATGRAWIEARMIRHALAQLAFAIQTSETGTEITRAVVEQILAAQPDISDPALLLRLAASASLLDVGERVRFTHQLLQEYFASEVMGAALDEKRSPTEFWPADSWWERRGWEETATILAGVRGDPEDVARWIAPAQPEVAYQALTESGVDIHLDEIQPKTRAALVNGANAKTTEDNPVGRAAAYRILGRFQVDDRPGIGRRSDGTPDIVWSECIQAGRFQMGGDPDAYQAGEGDTLELEYPFWVACYPVTYAQYAAFIDAGGYHKQVYWTKAGWTWKGNKTQPKHGWNNPQWHISNHPVVGVTWDEAYAFSCWVDTLRWTGKLELPSGMPRNYVLRLPTEAEWEKAARYPDGRKFPWGDEPDTSRLNSDEGSIGRTNAVGTFPTGTSSTGVYDLSGNVWEWCLSQWNKKYGFPGKSDPEEDAGRVLRGGSWSSDVQFARCASRGGSFPNLGLSDRGFRVVCSAPI